MQHRFRSLILAALVCILAACAQDEPADSTPASSAPAATAAPTRSSAPPGAAVFFIEPANGATLSSPVTVKFGISGMSVAPAGDTTPNTGHHHLLVDTELGDPSAPLPSDANHLHFGKGQTETAVELPPGQHTLQLVLGDANHIPHDPPVMSAAITITVE